MQLIEARNVGQALIEGAYRMSAHGVPRDSRNGKVMILPEPLTTVYSQPMERVLFIPERDANPYFHFMEALWMLGGRNDVEFPLTFNSKFGEYSDDGETFNAAYGYRWRRYYGADQLSKIITALIANPNCRRQVLAIWDGNEDLGSDSKDVPCNLVATFQIGTSGALDMMVANRSNDLIWGAYGANAVHFSFLLEYMARAIGVAPGTYTQVSANTHIYQRHWELMEQLCLRAPMPPSIKLGYGDLYSTGDVHPIPIMNSPVADWDSELRMFLKHKCRAEYRDPFFQDTAVPMWMSYISFKERHPDWFEHSYELARGIAAPDWNLACRQWLQRRKEARDR